MWGVAFCTDMTKRAETQIASPVVAWFQEQDWEVYQEVQPMRGHGPVADIVAVKGSLSWVVEVKTTRSLSLLDQALEWVGDANLVSVATPYVRSRSFRRVTWDRVCQHLGIGYFTVDEHGLARLFRFPRLQRTLLGTDGIRACLRDEHKTWAEAGNNTGSRWSPFQGLVRALSRCAEDKPGTKLSRFIEDTDHHYSTDKGAVSTLRCHIRDGVIPGLFVIGGRVYPEGYNHHSLKTPRP